jgi:hypothetical protein
MIDTLKLLGVTEALADELKRDSRTTGGRLPPSKEQHLCFIEAGQSINGVGEDLGRCMRIRESANRPINGNQLEGNLLRNGHHDLLQLGFGTERDQPDLAARVFRRQSARFIESAGSPGVEDSRQNHFVFETRAIWTSDRLEGLEWVGDNSRAYNDVKHICHFLSFFRSCRFFRADF